MGNIYFKIWIGEQAEKFETPQHITLWSVYQYTLIDLILTIPSSITAGCERGFSVMKSQRPSLATSTFSDLKCGLLESFYIDEYDHSKACDVWAE